MKKIRNQVMEVFQGYVMDEPMEDIYKIMDKLDKDLGITINNDGFSWKRNVTGDGIFYNTFKIGKRTIELSFYNTLGGLVEDITEAIVQGVKEKDRQSYLYQALKNGGCGFLSDSLENLPERFDLKEMIASMEKDVYCDEEFIKILQNLGYIVKTADFYNICEMPYIDFGESGMVEKVWLQEIHNPYTLLQEICPRLRIEILDILMKIEYQDGIFLGDF